MSRISITPNVSGTGTLNIVAPNTNTDQTLTLPDVTGTLVSTDASGNVGIGTTSPQAALDVKGTINVSTSIEVGADRTSDGYAYIDLIGDTTYTDYGVRLIRNPGANGDTVLAHKGTGSLSITAQQSGNVILATQNSERVRIDSSGNVGIGTDSPTARLEVKDASSIIKSTGTNGYGAFQAIGSGTNWSYLFFNNTTNGEQNRITSENGGALTFSSGNAATERMRITSSGIVTKPYQPFVYLQGNNSNTINFTSGQQLLTLTYYTTAAAYGDISWNSSNGRVTVGTSGRYMLTFAGYENGSSGRVLIYRNGGGFNLVHWSNTGTKSISCPIVMSAGDYIEVKAEPLNLPQLYMGFLHTHFSLYLLG